MIQIGEFRHPGIKIFKGHAVPADHFAFERQGYIALQNIANRLGHNSPGADGLG